MFRPVFTAFCLFALVSGAPAAHALSCAPPRADSEYIAAATAIFEGVVTKAPAVDRAEIDLARNPMDAAATVFTFQVGKGWKGVQDGETVEVVRNIYWGDGFQEGKAYLVFAENRDQQGRFSAGICGATLALEHAGARRQALQEAFGGE